MNKIFAKPRGQIAVLYAGIILVLVGAISLGADVSVMYANWQQSQKVADAAALAGANYLGGGITYADSTGTAFPTASGCNGETSGSDSAAVASQVACTYAVKNGLPASTITISETATTVKVVATQTGLPYFFGKAIGLSTYNVSATATAQASGPPTSCDNCGLVPLGLQCATPCPAGSLVAGEPVSFGTKFISSTINLAGNWGWLALGATGGKVLGDNIASGASGTYTVGQNVGTKPGGTNGQIKAGLKSRFSGCPSITPDPCSSTGNPADIPAGDPCLVIVPVVDFAAAAKNGSTSMPIEDFATVYLDPSTTDSTHINGCYVSAVVGNTVGSSTPPTALGPIAAPVLIN